jgi:hypothetical protein
MRKETVGLIENTLKSNALETLARESAQWQSLVEAAGDRLQETGVTAEWSSKVVSGHLLGWRNRSVAELEAAQRGDTVPPIRGRPN